MKRNRVFAALLSLLMVFGVFASMNITAAGDAHIPTFTQDEIDCLENHDHEHEHDCEHDHDHIYHDTQGEILSAWESGELNLYDEIELESVLVTIYPEDDIVILADGTVMTISEALVFPEISALMEWYMQLDPVDFSEMPMSAEAEEWLEIMSVYCSAPPRGWSPRTPCELGRRVHEPDRIKTTSTHCTVTVREFRIYCGRVGCERLMETNTNTTYGPAHSWQQRQEQWISHGHVHPGLCVLHTSTWEVCITCSFRGTSRNSSSSFHCLSPNLRPNSEDIITDES